MSSCHVMRACCTSSVALGAHTPLLPARVPRPDGYLHKKSKADDEYQARRHRRAGKGNTYGRNAAVDIYRMHT